MSAALLSEGQWDEFFKRLEGPEGCDFTGDPDDAKSIQWRCASGYDKTYSTAILTAMELPKSTVEAVLEYVTEYGGHCDCEVLFNAAERVYEDVDRAKLRVKGG